MSSRVAHLSVSQLEAPALMVAVIGLQQAQELGPVEGKTGTCELQGLDTVLASLATQ